MASTLYSQIGFQALEVTSFTEYTNGNKTGDIDGDGDKDIVSFGFSGIDWYQNNFPQDGFMPKKNVTTIPGTNYITSIEITDFDGDGDLDILGSEFYYDKLFFIPNIDGHGTFGPLQLLRTIDQIRLVKHIDMDNDGDKDLLYEAYGSTTQFIGYYENTNQTTNNYTVLHIVNDQYMNVDHDIHIVDIDNDGYPDVFYSFITSLQWIKNNGAAGFSALLPISTLENTYYSFDAGDIDNDGDADVVGYVDSNVGVKKIICHKYLGNSTFGPEVAIRQNLTEIKAVHLSDINNDNKLDIIVAIRNTNISEYLSDLVWYRNNGGTLSFTTMPVLDTKLMQVGQIATFDLNNDAIKDIITCSYSHRTTTYQNNGSGTFTTPKYPAAANKVASCAIAADMDGDGDTDVVTTSYDEGKIYWYKNTDNVYGNQIVISHDVSSAKKVAVADMDGDDDLDVVCISGNSDSGFTDKVTWYKNLGLGTFGPQINIPIGTYDSPDGLALFDVDGDGDKDIVTSLDNWPATGDKIVWYANDGSGNLSTAQIITTGPDGVTALKFADMDNDGLMDLVCASSADSKIGWYKNLNGLGSFGLQQLITSAASYVSDVAIADLDNDGDNDVAYVANGSIDDLLWQPNLGAGTFGATRIINSNIDVNGALTLVAADIDNDADIDIMVGEATKVTWSENLYGQANFEPPKLISSNVTNASSSQVIDADNDGDGDLLVAAKGNDKLFWFKNQGINQNTIKGTVRLDTEGNGCGPNDAKVPNIIVATTDGTTTLATLTFRNEYAGQYRLYTGEGNFETSIMSTIPTYYALNPTSHSSSFVGFGNIDTADFCIEPTGVINDLSICLYPLDEVRPGFNTSYQLVYKNVGTTTLTGQANLQYDNTKMQFLNATSAVTGQTANTLSFAFTDLAPLETRTVTLNFHISPPPTANIGNTIAFTATVTPVANDYTPQDNERTFTQTLIGSYDPNDITCLEGDQVLVADADKFLHYVIRFQNTGTASAINIKVQQLLDQKLDWTTLQLEGVSHNVRTTITNGSLVTFMFNNIKLPNSAANEAGSHGYILYKIKPKAATIVLDDVVQATANIYFDFNPPVITNTAATTYVNTLGIDSFDTTAIAVYPNPASTQLKVSSTDTIKRLQVYTIVGSCVLEESNSDTITIETLETGAYLLSVTTAKGTITKKFIKQ